MTYLKVDRGPVGVWWLRWIPKGDDRCLGCGINGTADPPEKHGRKWIYIREGQSEIETLRVILHELRHTSDPRASEEAVEAETDVDAIVLYALGYRRVAEPINVEEVPEWVE